MSRMTGPDSMVIDISCAMGSASSARTRRASSTASSVRTMRRWWRVSMLVVVGAMMMTQIREIDLTDFTTSLPAFLTIVVMPFTYSIANGIGAGFISYVAMRVATGRARQVHPLMWIVSVAFVVYFVAKPLSAAFA